MAEQDLKHDQKQQKQQQQQKPTKPVKQEEKKEDPKPVVYERPHPYGWFTVLFPKINNEHDDYHMALWLDAALAWVRQQETKCFSWTFVHGTKKDGEKMSPVFFFKDRYEALQCVWRLSGELVE
jgi:hypothetical protein